MRRSARLRWLGLTFATVLLDRASKGWFESQTVEGWRHELIHNFVYLVHSRNPGLAFGVLSEVPSLRTRMVFIVGSLAIIAVISWFLMAGGYAGSSLTAAGLALVLGGATGNVTDRILHGAVTDFLEVWLGSYRWPAFNVADSAITVGAILVLVDVLFISKHGARPSPKGAQDA